MDWIITLSKKVLKNIPKMPASVQRQLFLLLKEIEVSGPVRGNWANYSKLNKHRHHCHIKKGKPTYVVVWEVADNKIQLVEVVYAGTHEKAPY